MSVLRTSARLAVRSLGRNKLRTLLTMLGMIIGVAAVMTMVALGNGAEQSVEQDVRSAGTNLIHVNAGNYTRGGEESRIATGLGSATTLTSEDADAIGRSVAGIKAYAPGVKLRGWMISGAHRYYGQIVGTDVPFASMYGWRFDEGRWITTRRLRKRPNSPRRRTAGYGSRPSTRQSCHSGSSRSGRRVASQASRARPTSAVQRSPAPSPASSILSCGPGPSA